MSLHVLPRNCLKSSPKISVAFVHKYLTSFFLLQVDMPVFFFIDPEYAEDPKLEGIDKITLSYTFFEAKEGVHIPLPGYMQPHQVQGS